MKKVVITSLFVIFLILFISFSISEIWNSSNRINVESPDFNFSNQTFLVWNITQTGAEVEIEVEYEEKNDETTEFCLKLKDKTNYINNVSGNISQIPIIKLGNVSFNLSVDSFDFSGEELEIEECFDVIYENLTEGIKFKIGFNSINIETAESTGQVGFDSSIAIDSSDIVHISHRSLSSHDLRYCNNSGGSWTCLAVDTDDYKGLYSSIAIDSSDIVHISHNEYITNDNLRYCNNSGGSWTCLNVESVVGNSQFSSIAIDSSDVVHISHRSEDYFLDGELRYCNNSGGSWTCLAVEEGRGGGSDGVGIYSSIAIDSSDVVHISHHNGSSSYNLRYCNNSGGSWTCLAVDTTNNVGQYSSIAIDSSDVVHISHYDATNNNLRYCNNSGGSWTCLAVDTTNNVGQFSSIAIDSSDIVHIVHSDVTNDALRYCNNSGGSWTCTKLVDTPSNLDTSGRGIAIKKGRLSTSTSFSDNIHVSFLNDSTNDDLQYLSFNYSLPITSLINPINNHYNNSLTIDFNCTSYSSISSLKNVTFYVWNSTSLVNDTETQSITGTTNSSNFTIILPREEVYEWNCLTCETDHSCDFANYNFTLIIDTTNPNLSILYPTNLTNSSNANLNVNFTVGDDNLDKCWYSNDTFTKNTTITCGNNLTSITWTEGIHNVTVWANDSANNLNETYVTFYVDTTPPDVIIAEPQEDKNYANNNSIDLNFTVTDSTLSVDNCLYNVQYEDIEGYLIFNTTLTNCENTTFELQGGDYDYEVHMFVNDTLNNMNHTIRSFGIRTDSPIIDLNYPTNNSWFNSGTDIFFNFTGLDADGLSTCQLWGNWTTGWHKNYTWYDPTNNTMNSTNVNLTDGNYFWNVLCNDTLDNKAFATNNWTLGVDTVFPNISINYITTTDGSQTFKFNTTTQDINSLSCKYSIFDSTGIDGVNENISFTCDTETSATATRFATFNLTVYTEDLAGNENSSTSAFTLSTAAAGGGGGGGAQRSSTICIKDTGISQVSNVDRCIIYARIREKCNGRRCLLNIDEKNELITILKDQRVEMNVTELDKWINSYNENNLEVLKILDSLINRYNLFTGIIQVDILAFKPSPSNLAPFSLILSGKPSFTYAIRFNRVVKELEFLEGSSSALSFNQTTDSTADVFLKPVNIDFVSKIYSGVLLAVSTDDETTFLSINIRAINLRNPKTLLVGGGVILLIVFLFLNRKKVNKQLKKLFKVK